MIWHDYSYIKSMFAVDYNFAKIDVHSLRLSVKYTEEQMSKSREVASQTLDVGNNKAWDLHCISAQEQKANKVLSVVEALNNEFKIYQFKVDENIFGFKDKWDLFFWCNDKSNTMRGLDSGRDYSYVTLSFNDESMTYDERDNLLVKVLSVIEGLNTDIDVAVQHDLYWDKEKVKTVVSKYCKDNIGKMIQYGSFIGKIKEIGENEYGFFKKGAKKYGYRILDDDNIILQMAIQ